MATRLQSYLSGPRLRTTAPSFAPSFGGAEYLNRQQWGVLPKTADANVLNQTYLRSKAAHDALMQAQAMEAEQDNAILNTATPDELANLFGTPRTPREARLQKIVQKDHDAKEYGARLIPNQLQERQILSQNLANQAKAQTLYLNPLKFNLSAANFAQEQLRDSRNFTNQQQQRQHAAQQLAAQERFRQVQAQNAAANLAQRNQFHQQNFGQRQSNQELSQMLAMERMLQDRANAEQRQQNFQTGADRGYFQDVARAAERGALPPAQLSQFANRFDPATMAMLQGYSNVAAQNGFGPVESEAAQPGVLSRLASMLNPFAADPAAAEQWPDDSGYADDGADDFGMGDDFAPPPTMAARPAAPAPQSNPNVKIVPQNLRGNYVEGQQYPARDRSVWQYTNGQMVRIR